MQNVTLTSEEREVVLDYAARLEKRSRHWRVFRWLAVGCFVFSLGLLLAVDRLGAKMRSTFELPPETLKLSQNGGSKSVESALQMLAAHGDTQVIALRAEMYLILKALLVAGVGTALFVHVVSEWKRDRRDRLVVRLLRSFASSDAGEKRDEGVGP